MYVEVMLKPPSGEEKYRKKSFHAVPEETVEKLISAHTEYHNDEAGVPQSVSYSFERTDGGIGKLSLDLEMVAAIDAFEEEDDLGAGPPGRDPMVA